MLIFMKGLSLRSTFVILLIWTMAAMSMATQAYLSGRFSGEEISWLSLFCRQLPGWYLFALLSPFVLYIYQFYPLHTAAWRTNFLWQLLIAFVILCFFSNLRLWAMSYAIGQNAFTLSFAAYLNAYAAQLLWDTVVYSLIVLSVFALQTALSSKKSSLQAAEAEMKNIRLENMLKQARLETLKLQLSPHFLFNTLNTISSMVRMNDPQAAIKVNSKLGVFLRNTLYADDEPFVSLEKELEQADFYTEIESIRFGDRLHICKEIEEASLAAQVPRFILQPLLENAIKHGVAKSSTAGYILIRAQVKEKILYLMIYNDGRNLPEGGPAGGIGLKNLQSRLFYIYGTRYTFKISNATAKGVQVEIEIPL